MTDDLEYISEFIKEKTDKHKFEPDIRLSKFKRRIFWMNFFKFGWFHFNVYYLTSIVCLILGSICIYINFSEHHSNDNVNNFHNSGGAVIDTSQADSLSNIKHVTGKDTTTTNKKSTQSNSNKESTTKKIKPVINNDIIQVDTMNTVKNSGYEETTNQPGKDTLKVIVQDTVVKKVKIMVIDTLRNK